MRAARRLSYRRLSCGEAISVLHVALEQALVNLNQFNVSGDELRMQARCRIRVGYPHAATKREKKESYGLSTLLLSRNGDENP
jgi:hypothetical protein